MVKTGKDLYGTAGGPGKLNGPDLIEPEITYGGSEDERARQ
jgi:hypothetical protein